MIEKPRSASMGDLQVWMLSALLLGIGAGALLSAYLQNIAGWIVLVGLILHTGAMVRIYFRK